jgi:uncharacterized protein YbaR (Trm112 family)
MFIELVDALRCPVPHEESWLVATPSRMIFRHIVEGTIGCPVCRAEYPVSRGVADFRRGAHTALPAAAPADDAQAARLAAFLDLVDPTGFAALLGRWSVHAPALRAMVETPLVVVDPPDETEGEPGISVIRCDGVLPLAPGTARGIAIDEGSDERVASAVLATRPMGRVVAATSVPLPGGVTELARDEAMWVGERQAIASPLVSLHVRRGR